MSAEPEYRFQKGDRINITLESNRRNILRTGVFVRQTNHRNPTLVRVHINGNKHSRLVPFHCIEKTTEQKAIDIAMTSPALQWQSNREGRSAYPANFRGRVPLKVKAAKNVRADVPFIAKPGTIARADEEYYVWVNSYGAVSAILPNGEKLGLLPSEFDVVEWHPEENLKTA